MLVSQNYGRKKDMSLNAYYGKKMRVMCCYGETYTTKHQYGLVYSSHNASANSDY